MSGQKTLVDAARDDTEKGRSWVIGLTSLFFILLQSACTAFMALSGVRLLLGVSSLAAAVAGTSFLISIHGEAIRVPMEMVAVAGSAVNLYAIWRVRSLRRRPSSQWRVEPVTAKKKSAETIQIMLAVATLLLVVIECALHIHLHDTI